jgi:amino acid transporter
VSLANFSKVFANDYSAASVLKGTGSVGTSLIFWALGLLTSGTSLAVYLEYASYFPNRSGSEVVYLEQAFPRPKYFFPIAFAVQTVILSFSSGNAIGMHHNSLPEDSSLTGMVSHGSISFQDRRSYAHRLGKERRRHCLLYIGYVV